MILLKQAQDLWYLREERLKFYRRKHQGEFLKYFDTMINNQDKEFNEKDRIEVENIEKVQEEISLDEKQLKNLVSKPKTAETTSQIESLEDKIKLNRKKLDLYNSVHSNNGFERWHYMKRLRRLKQLYIYSVTEEKRIFQYGIGKFKDKMEKLVNQKLVDIAETDESMKVTRPCPKCHAEIYKHGGCIQVICPNKGCGCVFCWTCGRLFDPPHGSHFLCPFYNAENPEIKNHVINGIDYDDPNDNKFYPMPLDPKKMVEYVKFNSLYNEFNKNMQRYEELTIEFMKNQSKFDLKNSLINSLLSDNGHNEANKIANEIVSDILFAQSVVAWGQAKLYYTMNDQNSYRFLEFNLYDLGKKIDEFVECLKSCTAKSSDLIPRIDSIKKQIKIILNN